MKVLIYERAGGKLSIVHPAPKSRKKGESEEAWVERIVKRSVPANTPHVVIDVAELPRSRRWRDAWRLQPGGKVKVDMPEARKLRKAELLRRRDRLLAELREKIDAAEDALEASRADELRKQRKKLRSLEGTLDEQMKEIATLEALTDFVPTELRGS